MSENRLVPHSGWTQRNQLIALGATIGGYGLKRLVDKTVDKLANQASNAIVQGSSQIAERTQTLVTDYYQSRKRGRQPDNVARQRLAYKIARLNNSIAVVYSSRSTGVVHCKQRPKRKRRRYYR